LNKQQSLDPQQPKRFNIAFPLVRDPNIRGFYLLTIFNNAWFVEGIWVFFFLRYLSYSRIGLLEAIAFGFGLLMEIPTGAIADLIGKKITLRCAMLASCLGFVLMGSGSTFGMLLAGEMVAQLGWALYSGTAEAFAYDSLQDRSAHHRYDQVIAASHFLLIITMAVSIIAGGFLFSLNFRFPFYALAIAYALGFVTTFAITEPHTIRHHFSLTNYFVQLSRGIKQLLGKQLRRFFLIFFVLLGLDYLFNWSLLKPAMAISFGFLAKEQSIAYAIMGIVCAMATGFFPYLRRLVSDTTGIISLAIVLALAYIVAGFALGWYGIVVMITIALVGQFSVMWASVIVNREIPSEDRATTLSTLAFMSKIPNVVLCAWMAHLIDLGKLAQFNRGIAVVLVLSAIVTVVVISLRRPAARVPG
jgi:MFS family permease